MRSVMASCCITRWLVHPDWEQIVLRQVEGAKSTAHYREKFQSWRRINADEKSSGAVYVVADDDCLPQSEPFVELALGILAAHPDFGILSLWPMNCRINRWTPEGYTAFEDDEVMEHHSVGGIRFCRKGLIAEWPEQTGRGYDAEHCGALRAAGYRVGYFKNLTMNHVGEGYSTVWT